jgi:hypothetical protein
MSIKSQIFNELNEIEAAVLNLRDSESASKQQTDLEIAILRRQLSKANESRMDAGEKIERALSIIKALK